MRTYIYLGTSPEGVLKTHMTLGYAHVFTYLYVSNNNNNHNIKIHCMFILRPPKKCMHIKVSPMHTHLSTWLRPVCAL